MRKKYIPDPSLKKVELTEAEVVDLIGDVKGMFPKHASGVHHLLLRVLTTIREHNKYRSRVQSEYVALQNRHKQQGQSTSLNPIDAARFLKTSELEGLLRQRGVEADVSSEALKKEAAAERKKLNAAIGVVQSSLLGLLEADDLPSDTKAAVEKSLAALAAAEQAAAADDSEALGEDATVTEVPEATNSGSWVTDHTAEAADDLDDLFD